MKLDASRPPLANQPEDVDTVEAHVTRPTETLTCVATHLALYPLLPRRKIREMM